MLCFLGIITTDDLNKGKIRPSYILAHRKLNVPGNTGLCMVAMDQRSKNAPRILFREPWGHFLYEEYVANYRIKDLCKAVNGIENRKEHLIDGMVCYFPCNDYGEWLKNHPAIFVHRTAFLKNGFIYDQPINEIRRFQAEEKERRKGNLREQFLPEVTMVPLEESVFPTGFFYHNEAQAMKQLERQRFTVGGFYATDEKRICRSQFRQCERARGAEKHRQGDAELPELGLGLGGSQETVSRRPLRNPKDPARITLL